MPFFLPNPGKAFTMEKSSIQKFSNPLTLILDCYDRISQYTSLMTAIFCAQQDQQKKYNTSTNEFFQLSSSTTNPQKPLSTVSSIEKLMTLFTKSRTYLK